MRAVLWWACVALAIVSVTVAASAAAVDEGEDEALVEVDSTEELHDELDVAGEDEEETADADAETDAAEEGDADASDAEAEHETGATAEVSAAAVAHAEAAAQAAEALATDAEADAEQAASAATEAHLAAKVAVDAAAKASAAVSAEVAAQAEAAAEAKAQAPAQAEAEAEMREWPHYGDGQDVEVTITYCSPCGFYQHVKKLEMIMTSRFPMLKVTLVPNERMNYAFEVKIDDAIVYNKVFGDGYVNPEQVERLLYLLRLKMEQHWPGDKKAASDPGDDTRTSTPASPYRQGEDVDS